MSTFSREQELIQKNTIMHEYQYNINIINLNLRWKDSTSLLMMGVTQIQTFPCEHPGYMNTIFILLQEDSQCITMRSANEINHQAKIHTY